MNNLRKVLSVVIVTITKQAHRWLLEWRLLPLLM